MNCVTCQIEMKPLVRELHRCENCCLISSEVRWDPSIYDRSYSVKYKRYAQTSSGDLLTQIRSDTISQFVEPDDTLLDFGCGAGDFVAECKSHGIAASGFDINPYSGFCDVADLLGTHKVVTFWDSLEHLPDPARVIRKLNPEYVFVCTPSIDDFRGSLKDLHGWHHCYPEEHLHYFNQVSLALLLEVCGYESVIIHYRESKIRDSGGEMNILTMGGVRGKS